MDDRYKRQIIMPEITANGQKMLAESSVAVVGLGGLGSPVLYYLAAAGVGNILLVDSDTVEISNLNRQFLHFEQDIGRDKTQSAREKISRFNSTLQYKTCSQKLNAQNINAVIPGHDLVLSCVDNYSTRSLLNQVCIIERIPMIDGGVSGYSGYVMTILPGISPCYHCIYPREISKTINGILGASAGVIGSIMTAQAIKYLTGIRQGFDFLLVDLLSFSFQTLSTKIKTDCPVCQKH
ncbi:MAG: HesA/MoeB/ThiF family protein [Eubacteriales bacterium]